MATMCVVNPRSGLDKAEMNGEVHGYQWTLKVDNRLEGQQQYCGLEMRTVMRVGGYRRVQKRVLGLLMFWVTKISNDVG